ncbi:MAG TPA: lysylphosphatidylglycerol synthase transmembrane domain-containing protein [Candidatus Acidoferrum sp.]|nr:lysylphosphatidylglycerol synthase transmembrane domain-containing protein [Candidatus Acidoferrum sp.]
MWLPISIVLLAFVVWRSRLWEAGDRLGPVNFVYLVAAVLVGQVIPLLWAIRSADLLAAAGRPVSVGPLIPMTAFANTINNLTPGSVGELARMWLLRAHHGVDYRTSGTVIVIERFVAIGYLGISGLVAWWAYVGHVAGPLLLAVLVVLAGSPGILYAVGFRPTAIVRLIPLGRLMGAERWDRWIVTLAAMDETISRLLTHPARLATFALSSAAVFVISTIQLLFVGTALGVDIPASAAWGALGIATMAGVLSFLPFGLGATDLVLAGLLGVAGVEATTAAAMTFGYRLVATVPFALEGVLSYVALSASLPAAGLDQALREAGAGIETADGGIEP